MPDVPGDEGAERRVVILGRHVRPPDDPLVGLLAGLPGVTWRGATPDELIELAPARRPVGVDVLVFPEASGVVEEPGRPPRYLGAPERFVAAVHRLMDAGTGVVVLHEGLGAWPAWPEFAEMVGGRFLLSADVFRGRRYPQSGVDPGVRHHLRVVADHPVVAGLGDGFDVVDDPFLCPMADTSVTALLRSDHPVTSEHFTPVRRSALALVPDPGRGGPEPPSWRHPPGSDLAVWARRWRHGAVVCIQPGAGPATFALAPYRRLVRNAVGWVGSAAAREWAAQEAHED